MFRQSELPPPIIEAEFVHDVEVMDRRPKRRRPSVQAPLPRRDTRAERQQSINRKTWKWAGAALAFAVATAYVGSSVDEREAYSPFVRKMNEIEIPASGPIQTVDKFCVTLPAEIGDKKYDRPYDICFWEDDGLKPTNYVDTSIPISVELYLPGTTTRVPLDEVRASMSSGFAGADYGQLAHAFSLAAGEGLLEAGMYAPYMRNDEGEWAPLTVGNVEAKVRVDHE